MQATPADGRKTDASRPSKVMTSLPLTYTQYNLAAINNLRGFSPPLMRSLASGILVIKIQLKDGQKYVDAHAEAVTS